MACQTRWLCLSIIIVNTSFSYKSTTKGLLILVINKLQSFFNCCQYTRLFTIHRYVLRTYKSSQNELCVNKEHLHSVSKPQHTVNAFSTGRDIVRPVYCSCFCPIHFLTSYCGCKSPALAIRRFTLRNLTFGAPKLPGKEKIKSASVITKRHSLHVTDWHCTSLLHFNRTATTEVSLSWRRGKIRRSET